MIRKGTGYDAFGRRVSSWHLGDSFPRIYFHDMGGRLLAEYNICCNGYGWTAGKYAYFAGQRVGYHTDRVGSVRNTGMWVASHYYPYGELVAGTNNTDFKFAETYRDDSGLDYAMNRYYASGIGRFLSVDRGRANLGDPQSLNRFRYAGNDPVNRLDPSGLDDEDLVTFYGFSHYTYLNVVASIGGVRSGGGGSRAHGMAEVAIPEPAEPDGGGGGPVRVSNPASNWNQANTQLGVARDAIINTDFSQKCKDTLGLVNVSSAQLVQAAGSAQFFDATTSWETRASLYANTAAAGAAATQYGSQTISQWFSSDTATMAAADLNSFRIFFRSSGVDASSIPFDASLLGHELLHNITGFTDDVLKDKLGIGAKLASEWITDRLFNDCFKR